MKSQSVRQMSEDIDKQKKRINRYRKKTISCIVIFGKSRIGTTIFTEAIS